LASKSYIFFGCTPPLVKGGKALPACLREKKYTEKKKRKGERGWGGIEPISAITKSVWYSYFIFFMAQSHQREDLLDKESFS